MNVVRGGFGRQKGARNVGNRSVLTSNFNRNGIGLLNTSRITNIESDKSLNSKIKYPFDGVLNTTTDSSYSNDVMRPPFAPALSKYNKKKNTISSANTSNNVSNNALSNNNLSQRNVTVSGNNQIGFLDLSQTRSLWTPKYRHSGSGQVTGSNSKSVKGLQSKPTPLTSGGNSTMPESCIVLALSEGRGAARGEVGLAAIDLRRPSLTLCQLSDTHSYMHTLTALHFFNPIEIIVPSTFCDNAPTELYKVVKRNFSNISITAIQRRHFSDTQGLNNIKSLCAPEYASVHLQLMHKFYALTASAAVLKYVEYIQCVVFQPNSLKIEYHCLKNSMWIDVDTAVRLELVEPLSSSYERGGSLLSVLNQTATSGGLRALRASILQPSCNYETIKNRCDAVQELLDNSDGLMPGLQSVMRQLYDIDKILWLCMDLPSPSGTRTGEAQLNHTILLKNAMDLVPTLLGALEMAKMKWFLEVKKDLQNPKFGEISERIKRVLHGVVHIAHGRDAQQHRCFAVKPEINGLLDVARRSYTELVSDIQERIDELGRVYSLPLRLCKNSARGFHIGLTVGAKNKRMFNAADLPPIFIEIQNHGASVTMTTEDIVLLDQQANEALTEIQTMSNIVIYGLLSELRPYMSALYKLCEHVAELDVVLSLAQVSSAGYYVRPAFGEYLMLQDSIHPMLDYFLPGSVVPNNVFASPEYNFTIITGPNMGGKTIFIKQIGLLQIMAQIGCYVPAAKALFRISDKIFTRIGFNDSIECNSSTYILEIKEIHNILQTITPKSLVIIDELCRGTSSEEGTSMAWAVCEQLLNTSAFTFFTTHFLYLTRLRDMFLSVTNLHVTAEEVTNSSQTNDKQLLYKHKVMQGVTSLEHYGLTLASYTNLPSTVISLAKELAQVISAQKKMIQNSETKYNEEEIILYKLGADLMTELRQNHPNDERVRNIIGEFKMNNPEIAAKFCEQNGNDTTNTIPDSIIISPRKIISKTKHRLQNEDPLVSLEDIRAQYEIHDNLSSNLDVLRKVEDAHAIVRVSRNKSVSTISGGSVTVTPVQNLNVKPMTIVSDSLLEGDESRMEVDDECVDNRFKSPHDWNKTHSMSQNLLLNLPSTSKGLRGNDFIPPYYKSFNNFAAATDVISTQGFSNNLTLKDVFDEDDEILSQIDEQSIISSASGSFHGRSQIYNNNKHDSHKNLNMYERGEQSCFQHNLPKAIKNNAVEQNDNDNLTMNLMEIFGNEQSELLQHALSQVAANRDTATEDLENVLNDEDTNSPNDYEMVEDNFADVISFAQMD